MGVISLCWRLLCERPPSSLGFGQAHLGAAQAAGADAGFEQRRWPWLVSGFGGPRERREIEIEMASCNPSSNSLDVAFERTDGGRCAQKPRLDSCPIM